MTTRPPARRPLAKALALVALAAVALQTLAPPSAAAAPAHAQEAARLAPHQQLLRDIYRELVEINTTDTPAGDNTRAARAMAARLRAAGFPEADVRVVVPEGNARKGNLVARLRGTGARRPLLLLAHIDVVEALKEDWSDGLDPFTLTERDGYFYGRGTSDDKAMAAIFVANLIRYRQEGLRPDRDIILALTADEEGGDFNGVDFLLKNHRALVEAEFGINEGGGGRHRRGTPLFNGVQASEKVYQSFSLEVRNKGGHSSLPVRDNAIYRLAAGLQRLAAFDFPANLGEVTRAYFERASRLESGQTAADMRAVAAAAPDPEAARRLSESSAYYNALMRTTCVPTRLEGGHAENALPQTARATVNCRILPQETADEVRRTLARVLADDEIKLAPVAESKPSPPSPLRPEVMGPVERITAEMWPGVPVIPIMGTGATDSLYFRQAGVPMYGVSGIFSDIDDNRAHGRDERLGVRALYDGQEFLYRLVRELAAAGGAAAAAAQGTPPRPSLALAECEVRGIKGKARCGEYEVFENRATRQGRRIKLKVVVVPAKGPERAPDPYFYIPGGPGSSATADAPGIAEEFARINERRDLVFLDQRGTGGSHPLECPLFDPSDLQGHLGAYLPVESVRRCRAELEKNADLTLYTTPVAMDDLDEVRAALGYEKINLLGGSYGTRAALTYLKRHPESVRTVTLHGVSPTNQYMPVAFPADSQRALDGVLGECERDPACRAAFPRARAEAREVFDRLRRGPVEVEVLHPRTGATARVRLSRSLAAEAVRYMLYQAGSAAQVPLFLHLAAEGDFTPLAEAALSYRRGIVDSGGNGLYLSVTCAEDLPFIKPGEGERVDDTFLGSYRLVDQRAACALWPRGTVPADYSRPTRSDAPVLIITGQWDPVTPPAHGDEAAKHLPNSLHVVVPQGGHGMGGLVGADCVTRLMSEFVERGTARGLDTSCAAAIRRVPFATEAPPLKVVAVPDAELSRLAGRYMGEPDSATEVVIEAGGGRLKFNITGGPSFTLAPVSPLKFRVAGMSGVIITFHLADGRVTRITGHQGANQIINLVPKR